MENKSSKVFSLESLPFIAFVVILLKVLQTAFIHFFSEITVHTDKIIFGSDILADNMLWLPFLIFLAYFYLYRKGDIDNKELKNSLVACLFAIIPTIIIAVVIIRQNDVTNVTSNVYYCLDLLAWILVYIFLLTYWAQGFRLKKHHHHHHHHHHS